MLESYKKSYEEVVDRIQGWRDADKNDLFRSYVEYENDTIIAEALTAAIICRYWGAINKFYAKSYKAASPDECYNWLIQSFIITMKYRPWCNPENSLYNDPKGPDKAMNQILTSRRQEFFQNSNMLKRRINYGTSSVEALQEEIGDGAFPVPTEYEEIDDMLDIKRLVNEAFQNKEYLLAFMIDSIVNYDTFDVNKKGKNKVGNTTFNLKKLYRILHHLDTRYYDNFIKNFDVDEEEAKNAVEECRKLTRAKLCTAMKRNFKILQRRYEKLRVN